LYGFVGQLKHAHVAGQYLKSLAIANDLWQLSCRKVAENIATSQCMV